MPRPVKPKEIVELKISDIAFGGKGIAKINNYVIFVKNGAPGQLVKARITKTKSSFAEAKAFDVLQRGEEEIKPRCAYFENCGGCTHQNLSYDSQIQYLYKQVSELYSRLDGFCDVEIKQPIASENIFHYRNKMEFAFSNTRWLIDGFETEKPTDFALGLRAPGNYWKAIDIDKCYIAPEESEMLLTIIREFALRNGLKPFDQKAHEGFLRHVIIRKGQQTDQLLVNIVTYEDAPQSLAPLGNRLKKKLPNLRSFVNTVATNIGGTTVGDKTNLLSGDLFIEDRIGKLNYKISPQSFFQTNTPMAEKLYDCIKEQADLRGNEIIWDLYCGTGSIALHLARDAKKVIGFEIVSEAVKDANQNARLNNIQNVQFIEGNLDKLFRKQPELLEELPSPDLLIIDPPRAGMHPKLVKDVIQIAPRKILYVSCNPSTQVRDLQIIAENGGYKIDIVQPVDMFPHTPHIEVVTKLSKILN